MCRRSRSVAFFWPASLSTFATVFSAAVLAADLAVPPAHVKSPRRDAANDFCASGASTSSGNADARRTRTSLPCVANSVLADSTVASMPGTHARYLHVAQLPSTRTTSCTPRAASAKSTLSSILAKQGTVAYLSGSPSRRAAMRAHANTAMPSAASVAAAMDAAKSPSSGSRGMSASVGHTVVQAPHATQAPESSDTSLPPTLTASTGQACTHFLHEEWRLRTATHRSEATRTALLSSASAISTMSARFGTISLLRHETRRRRLPAGSRTSTAPCGHVHPGARMR